MNIWNAFDAITLSLLLICVIVWPTQWISDRQNRVLRIIAVSLVALQLIVDGPRAQLVPAYAIALLFVLLLLVNRHAANEPSKVRESKESLAKKLLRWTMVTGAGVFVLMSMLFCFLFPRFAYPTPSGQFALGTKEIRLVDPSRLELYTARPDDHREITVRITYPAEANASTDTLPRDTAHSDAAWILTMLIPNTMTPRWGSIPTHATVGPPIASAHAKYPVLIFSHGFPTGSPEQNTVLVEHLASHGYVVMAINHSWQSIGYQFADGTMTNLSVLTQTERALGPPPTQEQLAEEDAIWSKLIAAKNESVATLVDLTRKLAAANPRGTKFNSMTHHLISADQRFLMDCLNGMERDPILGGHLDVDHIGVFGMSAGGTASVMTCVDDPRCMAGVNLDGFQPLLVEIEPLTKPFMHMSGTDLHYRKIPHLQSHTASYFVYIKGAAHTDFTDAPLSMSAAKRLGLFGSIKAERMYQLTNDLVLTFFDEHLRGGHALLENGQVAAQQDVVLSVR
jgi:predicted dienelactone hydrolase